MAAKTPLVTKTTTVNKEGKTEVRIDTGRESYTRADAERALRESSLKEMASKGSGSSGTEGSN